MNTIDEKLDADQRKEEKCAVSVDADMEIAGYFNAKTQHGDYKTASDDDILVTFPCTSPVIELTDDNPLYTCEREDVEKILPVDDDVSTKTVFEIIILKIYLNY